MRRDDRIEYLKERIFRHEELLREMTSEQNKNYDTLRRMIASFGARVAKLEAPIPALVSGDGHELKESERYARFPERIIVGEDVFVAQRRKPPEYEGAHRVDPLIEYVYMAKVGD